MKGRMRPEIALTTEQATLIKEVLKIYLREFHGEGKERDTNYDYLKMIYEGLKGQHEGMYKIYADEIADVAKVIHAFNENADDEKYTKLENYLLSL